uniref:WRKY transcription factor 2-5 n=1 Tax=Dimocarpus longan TaxID=128017 RepID=G3FFB7_9ROSI|nr:WRKY transcription factor 2-5 [Dimocarpus longan]
MVSPRKDAVDEVAPDKSPHGQSTDRGSHRSEPNNVSEIRAPQSDQDGSTPLNVRKKDSMESNTSQSLRSDPQGSASSIKSEKASETTTDIILASPSGPEGSTPTIMREKVSEDGYNWRKYGQKLVRANEFIRSYYKCTYPNCRVKKQLDCTHSGHITDTIYFGQHDHPKAPNLPLAVGFVVSIVEERPDDSSSSVAKDKSSDTHEQTPHKTEPMTDSQLSIVASDDVKPLSQSNKIRDEINDDSPGSKRRCVSPLAI